MTVIDMKEARERLERRREDAAHQRMRHKIEEEKSEARANGLTWTKYRPFHTNMEAVGAMVCCSCQGRGRKRSTARAAQYVSYSTELPGRVTQCTWCYEGLGVVADELTLRMREMLSYAYDEDGHECLTVPPATRAALRRRDLVNGCSLTENGLKARLLIQEEAKRRRTS
jgi:hypothetical protein